MSGVRRPGPETSEFDWDFVASALHALADLIESCEVDRQLSEFDPDELRGHARALETADRSSHDRPGATPPQRPRLRDALASTVERVGPTSANQGAGAQGVSGRIEKTAPIDGPVDPSKD